MGYKFYGLLRIFRIKYREIILIKRFSNWCESVTWYMGSMSSHHSIEPMEVEAEAEDEVRCSVVRIFYKCVFYY